MMKITSPIRLLAIAALLPAAADAQEDAAPAGYAYSTYYVCDQATQGNMDSLIAANEAEVFDRWVEEGRLLSWGYLAHFTGGEWRRAQYHVSRTMAEALENQAEIFQEIYADNRAGGQARAEACAAHEDYLWALSQGSPEGTERGSVSLSVYFTCSVADQQRADDIFTEVFAPRLEQYREDGRIASWGWLSHVLGGAHRRAQTITGDDYAEVAAVRLELARDVNSEHPAVGREFAEICSSHVDYLWDIVHETQ
jgi:hypothetical protein